MSFSYLIINVDGKTVFMICLFFAVRFHTQKRFRNWFGNICPNIHAQQMHVFALAYAEGELGYFGKVSVQNAPDLM